MYSIGCSLVHFAMFVSIFFVYRPDYAKAESLDFIYRKKVLQFCPKVLSEHSLFSSTAEEKHNYHLCSKFGDYKFVDDDFFLCRSIVISINSVLNKLILQHFISFFVCMVREVNETNV